MIVSETEIYYLSKKNRKHKIFEYEFKKNPAISFSKYFEDGKPIKIKEIAGFNIELKIIVPDLLGFYAKKEQNIFKIETENKKSIICSKNQLFLMDDNSLNFPKIGEKVKQTGDSPRAIISRKVVNIIDLNKVRSVYLLVPTNRFYVANGFILADNINKG